MPPALKGMSLIMFEERPLHLDIFQKNQGTFSCSHCKDRTFTPTERRTTKKIELKFGKKSLVILVHSYDSILSPKICERFVHRGNVVVEFFLPVVFSDHTTIVTTTSVKLSTLICENRWVFKKNWKYPGRIVLYFQAFRSSNTASSILVEPADEDREYVGLL